MLSLRNLIELHLIIVDEYIKTLQFLKLQKRKTRNKAIRLETKLNQERKNLRTMLNNLELERIMQ